MNLEEVLPPGSVYLDVSLADRLAAITRAADLLAEASGVPSEAIYTALLAREALGSTGVGGSMALPHARMHVLRRTHAVFLRVASPIEFDSIDKKPVDLVCAVIAPDEPNAELLMAVAAMSRVLRDAAKASALRSAKQPEDAREVLVGAG